MGGGLGSVKGPAAIRAFIEENIPGPNQANNYHVLTNFAIDVHGDSATAWSRWTFVVPRPDKLSWPRVDWKFKRRLASNDIPVMVPTAEKNSSIRFMGMNTPACDGHLKDTMRYSRNLVQRDCDTSLGPGCLPPLAA